MYGSEGEWQSVADQHMDAETGREETEIPLVEAIPDISVADSWLYLGFALTLAKAVTASLMWLVKFKLIEIKEHLKFGCSIPLATFQVFREPHSAGGWLFTGQCR